jgi:hypothetical protein
MTGIQGEREDSRIFYGPMKLPRGARRTRGLRLKGFTDSRGFSDRVAKCVLIEESRMEVLREGNSRRWCKPRRGIAQ